MVRRETISRAASLLIAALIGVVTVAVIAHASQSITTPNAMQIPYDLSFTAESVPIALPVNQPVLVIGSDSDFTKNGNFGLGQATMNSNTNDQLIYLIAIDYGSGATSSFNVTSYGSITRVFELDAQGLVDLRTDGRTIFVLNLDNSSSGTGVGVEHRGVVKMIW